MMKRPDDLLTNCYSVYLQIMPSSAKSEIYATVAYIQSLCVILRTEPKIEITMKYKQTKGGEIEGHLDIFVTHNEDEFEGEISKWEEILIHGDPEGLRSFAKLLIEIADLNQEEIDDKYLPIGAREHYHLRPKLELANSSDTVVVGRLDAKGTGVFYDRFMPKDNLK